MPYNICSCGKHSVNVNLDSFNEEDGGSLYTKRGGNSNASRKMGYAQIRMGSFIRDPVSA